MSPGKLREDLERLQNEVRGLEVPLDEKVAKGMVAYIPIRHELTEAWDALGRAIESLDESYRSLS